MIDQVLSIKQMTRLEMLGADTDKASAMIEWNDGYGEKVVVSENVDDDYQFAHSTFTVMDMLRILPKSIYIPTEQGHVEYILLVEYIGIYENPMRLSYRVDHSSITGDNDWHNMPHILHETSGDIIGALYQMLEWCLENKHIKEIE